MIQSNDDWCLMGNCAVSLLHPSRSHADGNMETFVAINLLVVDDHAVVRSGLASLLSGTDIKIVAEASTPGEAPYARP